MIIDRTNACISGQHVPAHAWEDVGSSQAHQAFLALAPIHLLSQTLSIRWPPQGPTDGRIIWAGGFAVLQVNPSFLEREMLQKRLVTACQPKDIWSGHVPLGKGPFS